MKNFYVILWRQDFNQWVRTHPNAFTLSEAKQFASTMENTNVIHEMWLDCLAEWPEPTYAHALS